MLIDFLPSTPDVKTLLYADDVTLCLQKNQLEDEKITLQPFLDQVRRWGKRWKFKFAAEKCAKLYFQHPSSTTARNQHQQETNTGYVISPILESSCTESISVKLAVHFSMDHVVTNFTCGISSRVDHVISHVVCELGATTQPKSEEYAPKVWGMAEFYYPIRAFATTNEVSRPLLRTAEDDIKVDDLLSREPGDALTHATVSVFIDIIHGEIDRLLVNSSNTQPKVCCSPSKVVFGTASSRSATFFPNRIVFDEVITSSTVAICTLLRESRLVLTVYGRRKVAEGDPGSGSEAEHVELGWTAQNFFTYGDPNCTLVQGSRLLPLWPPASDKRSGYVPTAGRHPRGHSTPLLSIEMTDLDDADIHFPLVEPTVIPSGELRNFSALDDNTQRSLMDIIQS
ncbi:hypothetical protein OUZ56_005995 [Daphnia magna]|uniref:C2 PI3K-type domain-containing protein n=1 Tax=Daphnia magna TaxID=35525 RepID=A0ABQ9YUA6_9CRUS|nr:hypothetical protein OUZ56_005995 [Daphnia magna]